jgi:hypothetical protein
MSAERVVFQKKLNEVFYLEPNNLGMGFLTNLYKRIVAHFKVAPFIIIIPFSFIFAGVAYFLLGYLLIKLVSLLQYGF